MRTIEFLKTIVAASGVSGAEAAVATLVRDAFAPLTDEVRTDALGNVIALKRGEGLPSGAHPRVLLAGHMDEIGLIVTAVEGGFLRFSTVGGFDVRTLLGQEVVVHGQREIPGVIGCRAPHVLGLAESECIVPIEDLFIDVGLPADALAGLVGPGDMVTLRRVPIEMGGGHLAGKAMDDRAAVAAIAGCLELLARRRHLWDVYAVATVQEELGLRGATTAAFGIAPDLAVAIDVTFGSQPGLPEGEAYLLGGGPPIALGANIHPLVHERLVEAAKSIELPYQVEPTPGRSGTDAWAMQVIREGVPSGLVSIPLRNMHTTVEVLNTRDVERTSRLLAEFVAGLDEKAAKDLAPKVVRRDGQGGTSCC
ncbi:MAG: M42 family peptidase [Anaerolineae bacterium]